MKPVWFIFAWIFFVLGFIGAFMPILPTTPFLLLSAYLFSKSSPRFHRWLMELPVFGQGVRDWKNNRVIRLRAKILCSIMILISLVLVGMNPNIMPIFKISVVAILLAVWLFVVTRKSHLLEE